MAAGRALGAIVLVALGLGMAGSDSDSHSGSGPNQPLQDQGHVLDELDLTFRSLYAEARQSRLDHFGPILINQGDQLFLLVGNTRRIGQAIPPMYHRFKSIAHTPLALFTALVVYDQGPIDAKRLAGLRQLREQVLGVRETLDRDGFGAEALARQRMILEMVLSYLDKVLADRQYDRQELRAFANQVGPLVLANAYDATVLQLQTTHRQVMAWKRTLTADQWNRLRVLVIGRQMPRRGNAAVQYYSRLLGLPGESRRLVYAEQLADERGALNLLATHQLDSEIGTAFFNDPERMERDLLADAAFDYLGRMDLSR